jgi:hypothetical protein
MKGTVDFRAVLLGSLAGWGLSYLMSLSASISLARYYQMGGMPLEQIPRHMAESLTVTLTFLTLSLLASLFGGWSTANIAGHDPIKHGVATGMFYVATGLIAYLSPFPNGLPFWQAVITVILTVPLAMLGSILARSGDPYPA